MKENIHEYFKYTGWFRWSRRDAWKVKCSANDFDQCWDLLQQCTRFKRGEYMLFVLPSEEHPSRLKIRNLCQSK